MWASGVDHYKKYKNGAFKSRFTDLLLTVSYNIKLLNSIREWEELYPQPCFITHFLRAKKPPRFALRDSDAMADVELFFVNI